MNEELTEVNGSPFEFRRERPRFENLDREAIAKRVITFKEEDQTNLQDWQDNRRG